MMRRDRAKPPGRLPFDVPMTDPILDRLEQEFGTRDATAALDASFRWFGPRYPDEARAWREAFADLGAPVPSEALIGFAGVTHVPPRAGSMGIAYHLVEMIHPLSEVETVAQLESLPWPDFADPSNFAHYPADVAQAHSEGRVANLAAACSLFEMAWYLRGMDRLLVGLLDGDAVAHWLLEWFTERTIASVRAGALAGADGLQLGDDVGTQRGPLMAPPLWREHIKPRLARVVAAIREVQNEKVWIQYHSDGNVTELVEDFIEIGIDVLNPIQPECMDFEGLAARFGDRLGFWGMVGTQTTMPFGTPDDVRREIAKLTEAARAGVSVIAAPTHVLEPDVPWENVQAFLAAVREPLNASYS